MIISDQGEVVEAANARANARLHLRHKRRVGAICGRWMPNAQIKFNLAGVEFDPADPDTRVCRRCLRLARRYYIDVFRGGEHEK